jgi:hypothetical protein
MPAANALILVKVVHTVVWAFLASCIVAIPALAIARRFRLALVLTIVVLGEIAVLGANRMRCPLTDVAERYTDERGDNFDIYLPPWLARNNKLLFGSLFVAGEAVLAGCWLLSSRPEGRGDGSARGRSPAGRGPDAGEGQRGSGVKAGRRGDLR